MLVLVLVLVLLHLVDRHTYWSWHGQRVEFIHRLLMLMLLLLM